MKKQYLALSIAFTFLFQANAQKILFDNTHAETAGNADWVIDADAHNLGIGSSGIYIGGSNSNAQRIPTPAQSAITSSTAESYWEGGISAWGVECVKTGYTVESLPWGTAITYGTTATQDLKNYDVYVVDEPNTVFTASEKTAILNFVKNGGGIYMVSDHTGSDRNGDGWDSQSIWNDLMRNNTVHANPFGLYLDSLSFSGSYFVSNIPGDSIVNGPYGNVSSVKWSSGTSMTLNPTANSTVKGVVYKSGGSGNNGVLLAYGRYGTGKFVVMGDSSPTDDASGDPGDQLYDGWIADANGNHRKMIMNATIWLATKTQTSHVGIDDISTEQIVSIVPNPAKETLHIKSPEACTYEIIDLSGRVVLSGSISADESTTIQIANIQAGMYLVKLSGETLIRTTKIIKE